MTTGKFLKAILSILMFENAFIYDYRVSECDKNRLNLFINLCDFLDSKIFSLSLKLLNIFLL